MPIKVPVAQIVNGESIPREIDAIKQRLIGKATIIFGNGKDTSYNITHNLNTRFFTASIYEHKYAKLLPLDVVSIVVLDDNTIKIDFPYIVKPNEFSITLIG